MKVKEAYEDALVDQKAYQKLIGELLYLNMTRPDITFSTQSLSQFSATKEGLVFSTSSNEEVSAFFDADWASCAITRKSVSSYMVKMEKSLVSLRYKSYFNSLRINMITWMLKEVEVEVQVPTCI